MLVHLAILFFILYCNSVNGDICTPASTCVVTRCPGCSVVTVAFYQTNPQLRSTFVAFNVSNQCSKSNTVPGIISVDFNINSPSQGLTLTPSLRSGTTYQGSNYQWAVSYVSPSGSDSLPAPKPTQYIRFAASGGGVVSRHQTGMVMPNALNYEIYKFSVSGYDPIYNWVFRIQYGTQYEVHGYVDISSCFCDSCDSKHQKRVVTPCTLGYPDKSTSRSTTLFNEDLILYSFAVTGNYVSLYYSDEFPIMLGLGKIQEIGKPLETLPGLNLPLPTTPVCIFDPNFGSTNFDPRDTYGAVDNSGSANGCSPNANPKYSCPRPLPPSLFLTDITFNPNNRDGDWQQNGSLYLPNKICGLYFYTQKNIKNPRLTGDGFINADILGYFNMPGLVVPKSNCILGNDLPPWNFGAGADPIPVFAPLNSATNRYEFGVQVGWDVGKLPLKDSHNYRFQIMAHDGDSTKIGGDIGEACVNIIVQCDEGFLNVPGAATPCSSCDTRPLPGDGKWTWFCSPISVPLPGADSPIEKPYVLTKIPMSKLSLDPYKTYLDEKTGFIPTEGFLDKNGFAISCDCKRTIKPCPLNCCGNGKCDYLKGTCTCFQPAEQLLNASTCCPTLAPTGSPTPPPTPAPTPVPKKCPNDCCSRVVCDTNLGACNCPAPFNAPPYNSTDCCLLPTVSPTRAPTGAPTTPAPTEFLEPTAAPTAPTTAPTDAPTRAPTEEPCFNNGKYCNGNGICNTTVPICVCTPPFFGADCSNFTLPPTKAPTDEPPCFNEGKFCNGRGNCSGTPPQCICDDPALLPPDCRPPPCFNDGKFCNGAGVCNSSGTPPTCICDNPADLPPDCSKPPLPPPNCSDIANGTTCDQCLDGALALGINCVFCPENVTLPSGESQQNLNKGTCSNVCTGTALATCQPVIEVIPPVCPDNCSGNGMCVNLTKCDQLHKENLAKYGNDSSLYPLDCGGNANESRKYNQTGACACVQGFYGLNCALIGKKTLVALAALGAGLIALIVILACLGAAMAGGGAAAVYVTEKRREENDNTSGVASSSEATVVTSPLYQASSADGTNPLFSESYEMFG